MFILYLAVLGTAMYWVAKLLGPEMAKPPLPKAIADFRVQPLVENVDPHGLEKLEVLLAEKNKNIQLLQTELKIFQVHVRDFEKVKTLMDEEIRRLREQNRIFRSELGLPSLQLKETTIS